MALSKIKKLILVEDGGAMVPAVGATCYVYHATTFTLAQMYTDRTGTTLASNPATVGADGYLDRYIESGPYDLRVVSGLDETTYPDFLAVDDIIVSGPSGDLQFSDVANLKAATPLNQKSYKVNWAGQLGRKVSTVVHNTTSNEGGADYVIVNVNPGNLSTLVGGIWVGANHDLGGGFYAQLVVDNGSVSAEKIGCVPDGVYDNANALLVAIDFVKAIGVALSSETGGIIYASTSPIVFNCDLVGDFEFRGFEFKHQNGDYITQSGGTLRCEKFLFSGGFYNKYEKIRTFSESGGGYAKFDGGGGANGGFWNEFGNIKTGLLHFNADNGSFNVNNFGQVRCDGGFLIDGGFAGNPNVQEIDCNTIQQIDVTGGDLTATDGRSGYQILDERYDFMRTLTINQLYAEVSGAVAIRGNIHIKSRTCIDPTSNLELPPWNHVLFSSQWTNRGSGDFFAGNPVSNLAVGGCWDILGTAGQPLCLSQSGVTGVTISDDATVGTTTPGQIGYSYGGTATSAFSTIFVALKNSYTGKYHVWLYLYAPDGINSITFDRNGSTNNVGSNAHYWDMGAIDAKYSGWRLYRISGSARSDGVDDRMRIICQGGTPVGSRIVRVGGVWASPEKTVFNPTRPPSENIKAYASSAPATGAIPSLPSGGIVYNTTGVISSGTPIIWRKNSDGTYVAVNAA